MYGDGFFETITMKIAIIGLGGVGGYYGGKLAQLMDSNQDLQVYFVARGAHLHAMRQSGLQLKLAEDGKTHIIYPTDTLMSISELPIVDLVLIAVKSYDLEEVVVQLKDKIHSKTEILPLLNGVGIYERVRAILPDAIIYPACIYILSWIEKPGVVVETGGSPKLIFGPDLKHPAHLPDQWTALLHQANVRYVFTKNHLKEIWTKYMYIAPYALVTARYNQTVGQVYEGEKTSQAILGIMREIEQIACHLGIQLDEDVVERSFHLAKKFDYHATTSFQRDYLQKEKKNEKELFGKAILDYGVKLGITTPVTKEIYEAL
mgnify:FL=1